MAVKRKAFLHELLVSLLLLRFQSEWRYNEGKNRFVYSLQYPHNNYLMDDDITEWLLLFTTTVNVNEMKTVFDTIYEYVFWPSLPFPC